MTLNVRRVGETGPDVAFIHGWGLSGRIWDPLAARLRTRLRCHLVDLPGHGDSACRSVGLNNWADEVVAAVGRPAVYVGWSLGGLIALAAARRQPQQVDALVLVASLARFIRESGNDYGMRTQAIEATRAGLARDFSSTLSEFLMQQVLGEPGAAKAVRSLRNDLIDRPPGREGLERALDILIEADLRNALAQIAQPALLVAGTRDRIAHPDSMAAMAKRMPRARFWRVERAAHAPFISHEKAFCERLVEFANADKPSPDSR